MRARSLFLLFLPGFGGFFYYILFFSFDKIGKPDGIFESAAHIGFPMGIKIDSFFHSPTEHAFRERRNKERRPFKQTSYCNKAVMDVENDRVGLIIVFFKHIQFIKIKRLTQDDRVIQGLFSYVVGRVFLENFSYQIIIFLL